MSKLIRPYIPRSVRCQVAARQLGYGYNEVPPRSWALALKVLLEALCTRLECPLDRLQLDHDPALENRKKVFRDGVHVDYDPPANDPAHLIYREKHAHHIKTNVRGDHGQFSDNMLAKRERKRKRKALNLPTRKIQSRGFQSREK